MFVFVCSTNKETPEQTPPKKEIEYWGRGWREMPINSTNKVLYDAWLQPPKPLLSSIAIDIVCDDQSQAAQTALVELKRHSDVLKTIEKRFPARRLHLTTKVVKVISIYLNVFEKERKYLKKNFRLKKKEFRCFSRSF